jgi:hypothetical protein
LLFRTNKKSELLCYFIIFLVRQFDHFWVNWWDNEVGPIIFII